MKHAFGHGRDPEEEAPGAAAGRGVAAGEAPPDRPHQRPPRLSLPAFVTLPRLVAGTRRLATPLSYAACALGLGLAPGKNTVSLSA